VSVGRPFHSVGPALTKQSQSINYRDIASCGTDVNRKRTDGRSDDPIHMFWLWRQRLKNDNIKLPSNQRVEDQFRLGSDSSFDDMFCNSYSSVSRFDARCRERCKILHCFDNLLVKVCRICGTFLIP